MMIAPRMRLYLDTGRVAYSLVPRAALISPDARAKALLLRDDAGYLLAVLPAAERLALDRVCSELGRELEFASEQEVGAIFADCDAGATPPFGAAYGIPTAVDEALLCLEEVCFEVGCDGLLARVRGADFATLLGGSARGDYRAPSASSGSTTPRARRPADGLTHVLSLRSFGAGLRGQTEYQRNGHAGMLLLKTPELRVVLEAVGTDTILCTHVVHGPTTLLVLEGTLEVTTKRGTFRVAEGEMASLPREERREIYSPVDSLFLLALGRLARPEEVRAAARPRRVLILANRTAGGAHLVAAVRERIAAGPCEFVLLAPAVEAHPRAAREEGAARDEAQRRLDAACARLGELGVPVRGTIGDVYPLRAVQDLLLVEDEGFDEIILSTLPEPISEWRKLDLPARIARRFRIPVTQVVAEE